MTKAETGVMVKINPSLSFRISAKMQFKLTGFLCLILSMDTEVIYSVSSPSQLSSLHNLVFLLNPKSFGENCLLDQKQANVCFATKLNVPGL